MISGTHGTEREHQVREIAARLGVADFVYAARPVRKGAALREASGDGLLIVGSRGAVLQVKAREPGAARADSEERASAWIRKQASKARDQGFGTKRELARRQSEGNPLVVLPVRAAHLAEEARRRYELTVSTGTGTWPVIVVLEHPACPEIDLGFEPGVLWFTFQDWLALHYRLRSTAALLTYCQRILADKHHVPLKCEAARYAAMRAADEIAASSSSTSLPYLSDAEDFDALGTEIFHEVVNKVWPNDGDIPWRSASEYRKIVETLDAVPPQAQSIAGRWFLRKRAELASGRQRASGIIRMNHHNRLVFGCSDRRYWDRNELWFAEFSALTALRHTQAFETGAPSDSITLGIAAMVEERQGQHGVSYFFLLLDGRDAQLPMPADLRMLFEWQYGVYHHRNGTVTARKIGGNQPCPCMSGNKYKRCHGRQI